jgi:hypothetical protein
VLFISTALNIAAMNKKLTLTIDKDVIKQAKKYSKEKGKSLSEMVENYLKATSEKKEIKSDHSTALTRSLRGSFKEPSGFDYKKSLSEELEKKYN